MNNLNKHYFRRLFNDLKYPRLFCFKCIFIIVLTVFTTYDNKISSDRNKLQIFFMFHSYRFVIFFRRHDSSLLTLGRLHNEFNSHQIHLIDIVMTTQIYDDNQLLTIGIWFYTALVYAFCEKHFFHLSDLSVSMLDLGQLCQRFSNFYTVLNAK